MKTKLIVIILFLAVGLGTAVFNISSVVSENNEYNRYIAQATANAEKDIPYVAVSNYMQAFAVKEPSEETYLMYMEEMKKLGEDYYLTALEDYLVRFPMSSNAYELNIKRLFEDESYNAVVDMALEAREKGVATETIRDYYVDSYYKYTYLRVGFSEATTFIGDYALVKQGELYGYLSSAGDFLIAPCFKEAGIFLGATSAANDGTGYHMINALGFKIAITSEPVDYLSFLMNDNVLAGKDGKYAYLKTDLIVPETFPYDDATNFKNQVAAVCQDGKWALISPDGKNITDFIFEDVIRDEYNTCISNGIIFAKSDGKYYMYNSNGKKISDEGFDDAYPFVGSQPAAVKIGDKWGFADSEGKIVIEAKYEDAKSFNCSLAPVCTDGVWDYIDSSETVRLECDFEDAKPFAANGIAAIKEGEAWNYIKLITY